MPAPLTPTKQIWRFDHPNNRKPTFIPQSPGLPYTSVMKKWITKGYPMTLVEECPSHLIEERLDFHRQAAGSKRDYVQKTPRQHLRPKGKQIFWIAQGRPRASDAKGNGLEALLTVLTGQCTLPHPIVRRAQAKFSDETAAPNVNRT